MTGQQEGQADPTGRGPAAIPRRDAYAYHRIIVISARRGTQRSAPSDEGRAVHLVRVEILIAVVLPRGALLQQRKRSVEAVKLVVFRFPNVLY